MWKTVMESPQPGMRFMALYADGSGAGVYRYGDDGSLWDAAGDFIGRVDGDWFADAGFSFWAELPEGFALWGEE